MTADRPNVVLVSIDSLRADHCGFLGDDRGLTPTMDTLADEGVSFETAIAPGPRTFSTMPAVFTGRHRPLTPLNEFPGDSEWERRLTAIDQHLRRYAPLPERLQELGYSTAGFSPNPWASSASGFDRGFDAFTDRSGNDTDGLLYRFAARTPGLDPEGKGVELLSNMLTGASFFSQWEELYDDVLAARERLPEPYFLWVFLLDTHFPFIAARDHREEQSLAGMYASTYRAEQAMRGAADGVPPAVGDSLRRSYRDTVRAVDAFLDRLRTDLAEDDPALVVHSDHGESFGEHGGWGHHLGELYEENVHVPYLVHGADVSATVTDPTSLTSVYDATLSIAREGTVDPAALTEPYVVSSNDRGYNRAVRGRRYKYVDGVEGERLFDLERDPDERTDRSRDLPAVCRELADYLDGFESHRGELDAVSRAATAVAARETL
jgi:arylsulfatase A-like enzyme